MKSEEGNSTSPTHEEMEALFVNNAELDKIKIYLNRFNPIKIMRMEHKEIRHSAILAWLLDPSETHGLGDEFLKSFLAQTLKGESKKGKPTALDISQSELRDTEVRLEWEHIDILIINTSHKWAFVVENKFHSKQHSDQLRRYREKIEKYFPGTSIRGIFLTLKDEDPEDNQYLPIKYEAVCELLSHLLQRYTSQLAPEVKTFLKHYLETIEEAAGMSKQFDEMETLAKELYRNHKKVLDFVIEHGSSSEFAMAAKDLFGEDADQFNETTINEHRFVFSGLSNDTVSFLPSSWYTPLKGKNLIWAGCENWWAGFPVIAFIKLIKKSEDGTGLIRLYAEVGPIENNEERSSLIDHIAKIAEDMSCKNISFQRGASEKGRRYSRFLRNNSIKVEDTQDAESIAKAIKELLKKFQPEFDIVKLALENYQRSITPTEPTTPGDQFTPKSIGSQD